MAVRILIVEDEYIIAADLEMKLTRLGYEVVGSAVTGEEAIALAERHRPDVVLMDIQLQGRMTGMAAAETIRAGNRVPIIFVTAFAGMLLAEKQGDVPSELYLTKPFSATELKMKLEASLERDQSND